ncbi:TatD family hydrolase [Lentibacillus sp. Marseille-P4043]|uniref:TatD family hydrolase n=1 Tax=Lentibacillus sp. Marseille-P4043 TaxID=2040293 RepID=UPI0022787D42|nr:TatD family hydrolase [Lentibacillus sp. Marseille-P4043]
MNNVESQVIDAHIHLDMYGVPDRNRLLKELKHHHVAALIAVSCHLQSAEMNLEFSRIDKRIKPAFGYHPEQELPSDLMLDEIIAFMQRNQEEMVAVGEVGLPYYSRQKNPNLQVDLYLEILELFIQQAVTLDKPIVLHAVYDDAPLVCDLLEKHSVKKAHFHWFKGDYKTIERMQQNGYYISITPDVLYEREIQQLVKHYPLSNMMVETDGPWRFKGPFMGEKTHPKMIHQSVAKIAELKGLNVEEVYCRLYENTSQFYCV